MRAFTIRSSDVEACPIHSLAPEHYRDDGTCRCGEQRCAICGEPCDGRHGGTAEMFTDDPAPGQPDEGIVHADCGIDNGWDVA